MENVNTFINYLNKIHPNIVTLLKKTGAIISGSSVLKFYNNETYTDHDIDIYVTRKHGFVEFNEWYDECCKEQENFSDSKFNLSFYSGNIYQPVNEMLMSPPFTTYIEAVRPCIINGVKIDIIMLSQHVHENPIEFIKEYFDFGFCKCVFDGSQFITFDEESIKKRQYNLKSSPLILSCIVNNFTLEDVIQYEYDIKTFNIDVDISSKKDPMNYLKRLAKYTKRGFKIVTKDFCFELEAIRKKALEEIKIEVFKKMYRCHYIQRFGSPFEGDISSEEAKTKLYTTNKDENVLWCNLSSLTSNNFYRSKQSEQ